MKTRIALLIMVPALALYTNSFAQNNMQTEGSVWAVSLVKTNPGMDVADLNSLKTSWKAVQDEAIKQGLIVSYSIINGVATSPDDYNMALMVEYKNSADMLGQDEKWDAIQAKVISTDDARAKLTNIRTSQNAADGQKLMREAFIYSLLKDIPGLYPQKPGC